MKKNTTPTWFRLDTSAKIYPARESVRDTTVFRVAFTLEKKVDPVFLLQALENIRHRFPYYNVHLKRGLFWNYFQTNNNKLFIWPDTPHPCERIHPLLNNGFLYKIKYYNKTLALEIFHGLTDGYGATEFLKCLLHQYLFLLGKVPEKLPGIMSIDEEPEINEYEDAFIKVYEQEKDNILVKKRSLFGTKHIYQIKDKLMPQGYYNITTGIFSVEDIKRVSKQFNATITEFLAALYLESIIHLQASQVKKKKNHRDVALQIPVNVRNYYRINCMRNFSLFVIPTINPRDVANLQDITNQITLFMKAHLTHSHLLSMIEDNCSLAKNQILKFIPVDIKNLFIGYISNTMGSSQFSGTLSNMGIVKFPIEMEKCVTTVTFLPSPSPHEKCSCGLGSYKNNIYMSFGRSIENTHIERHLFRRLVQLGVHVTIKSNQ